MIIDSKASNGYKARIAGGTDGRLRFDVHVPAPLLHGFNRIDIEGGAHALDIDYLQLDAGAAEKSDPVITP